jgi:uncharacterized membrane protein YecN with MAPEG domain
VAWLVFSYGSTATYQSRIAKSTVEFFYMLVVCVLILLWHDYAGWLSLSLCSQIIAFLTTSIPAVVAFYARYATGCEAPQQLLYVAMTETQPRPLVLLDEEGVNGRFNRAQRAISNFQEYIVQGVLAFVLALQIFPFPAFAAGCLFVISRFLSPVMYRASAKGRGAGFGLSVHVGLGLLQGLLHLTLIKLLF